MSKQKMYIFWSVVKGKVEEGAPWCLPLTLEQIEEQ